MSETYLNHPNFGLLFRICQIEDSQELFTTLYAQRLFFLVTNGPSGLRFEPISRSDARLTVEIRLRTLRRSGKMPEYEQLQKNTSPDFSVTRERRKRAEGRGQKDNIYGLILCDRALPFSLTDYLDFFIFDGIFLRGLSRFFNLYA
jgi:PII interaction protein X